MKRKILNNLVQQTISPRKISTSTEKLTRDLHKYFILTNLLYFPTRMGLNQIKGSSLISSFTNTFI